ncbi:Mannose-6-phosphate isomerase [Tetrabaena socialis]|uniref:mannose-6-phosphate isomerase n=1 Tax=Tetrabaena socialis TaxID=47790 RepID=A0A2J7ZRA3_9CHLO|nr:Mannose-6-phosphate isomerase [Tetrabaena socialis]|eukprot:PNH02792.1 Mannose-6-phosphate isomerase [Tetrabaena socialis]
MGAHPNCPSKLQATGESLQAFLERHPQMLGGKVQQHFGTQLPFLFKVLSVNKALSIQSHPDKALAEKLHAEHPKLYADPNHKPELALALSDFEALCGFVTTPVLQERLRLVPELAVLVGQEAAAAVLALGEGEDEAKAKQVLRAAFTALMTASPDAVLEAVRGLVARLGAATRALSEHEALALRLNGQFPDDVGVLSAFFLNVSAGY